MAWQPQTFQPAQFQGWTPQSFQPDNDTSANQNNQPSTATDVGKSLVGNVAPNAVANLAANVASPLYTAGSYAAQLGMKGGEYLGEGGDSLYRLATGQPQQSQANYDQNSLDLMNAMRAKIGMSPTNNGDPSNLVPTPSNLVSGAANLAGYPLYQPQTQTGQLATNFGNIATGGLGSGAKVLPSVMAATGGSVLPAIVQQAGGSPSEQYLAGLAGGIGGAKLGSMPADTNLNDPESQNLSILLQKNNPVSSQITGDQLKNISGRVFDLADAKGGALDPADTDSFINSMYDTARDSAEGQTFRGSENPLLATAKNMEVWRGKPLSFAGATDIDNQLTDLINSNKNSDNTLTSMGQQYLSVQDKLRDLMSPEEGATADDGFDLRRQAQQLWGQGRSLNDVQNIIDNGQRGTNPSTAIMSGFNTLAKNNRRMNFLTDDEQDAVRNAATRGLGGDFFNTFGSRLGPFAGGIIGSVGGPIGSALGAATAYGLSAASRNMAEQLQLNRANAVTDLIRNRHDLPDLNIQPEPSPLMLNPPSMNVPQGGYEAVPNMLRLMQQNGQQ